MNTFCPVGERLIPEPVHWCYKALLGHNELKLTRLNEKNVLSTYINTQLTLHKNSYYTRKSSINISAIYIRDIQEPGPVNLAAITGTTGILSLSQVTTTNLKMGQIDLI